MNTTDNPSFEHHAPKAEIKRRRTFGIISHPDAGKTTLTEKLLLFGGAIKMAGAVKARKADRHATSDWMAIEQERGISVTSSVMKFNYRDYEINLLDTPGHQDFSEDTYRVLTAVDSAVMVIDSVKGVETQTRKLMEVCRMRNTPILTFINKLDREGMSPLDILADIEESLQIECAPLSWPIGMGKRFKGTYNLYRKELNLFTPGQERLTDAMLTISDLDDPLLDELLGSQADELREDVALLEGAANPFDLEDFLKGNQTPVFFGSAINNFGVRELLDTFVEIAPAPLPRPTITRMVSPDEEDFSGFVFKIQANMDPAHRDRIAFLRICSGRFQRGDEGAPPPPRQGSSAVQSDHLHGPGPGLVEEAWPGRYHRHPQPRHHQDRRYLFRKGTAQVHRHPEFRPGAFPAGAAEIPLKAKQLQKGLTQLAEEGTVQLFRPLSSSEYILGAVGVLQFEVTMARLKTEYGVDAVYEGVDYAIARWVSCADPKRLEAFEKANPANLALDSEGNLTYLDASEWRLQYVAKQWPEIIFMRTRERD